MTDDDRSGRGSFTLVELAEVSGVPARTIRFYIARGLLAPPLVGGRAACYNEEHLKELHRIKTLQRQGRTLAQIAWQLGKGEKEVRPPRTKRLVELPGQQGRGGGGTLRREPVAPEAGALAHCPDDPATE